MPKLSQIPAHSRGSLMHALCKLICYQTLDAEKLWLNLAVGLFVSDPCPDLHYFWSIFFHIWFMLRYEHQERPHIPRQVMRFLASQRIEPGQEAEAAHGMHTLWLLVSSFIL